ncbi:MAG: HAMP domain-containing protein [Anaerolineae bacterium]|nr:HAMP domain-containing protein [Anaerolineae bacterium]
MRRLVTPWRDFPIGSKLAMLTSLLVVVVVVALTVWSIQRERTSFRQELEQKAALLLDTLPLTLRDQLYLLQVDELLDVASAIAENENVTLFIIYDRNGSVLVDANVGVVFTQSPDPLGEQLLTLAPGQMYLSWQETSLLAGRAVVLGNRAIGAMVIGLSTAPLSHKIAALTRQSLALSIGAMVLGITLSFLLARQIANPLRELATVATQMSDGDFSQVTTRSSRDEIGRLGVAFNRMSSAIQRRDGDLRELAAGLEQTVAERTAELREQNAALVQTNEALTQARKEAEMANRAKTGMLSVVSHEMRTPLTSILGFAKLAERRLVKISSPIVLEAHPEIKQPLSQMRDNIGIIVSEGERLVSLINNLLDLAKIEAGKLEWTMRPVAIEVVVNHSLAATASLLTAKSLEMVVEVAPDLPMVTGDHDRLIQVMVNLISNAIKFTETGTITCRAICDVSGTAPQIVVSVQDTGVGIDPDDFDKVFEQFTQVAKSATGQKGTGLGLPICKQIVEHHGGRIWVESVLGQGSTFYFSLPVDTPDDQTDE